MNKKISTVFAIAVIVLIGGFLAGVFWFLGNKKVEAPMEIKTETAPQNEIKNNYSADDISQWQTFRNVKYGYQIKHPKEVEFEYIPSGIPDADDQGYIVDFRFPEGTIRIESSKNSRKDKTLEELIAVRDNIGMQVYTDDKDKYEKISVDGSPAFRYQSQPFTGYGNSEQLYGLNTLLLGSDYYYQITTTIPYNSKNSAESEKNYKIFVDSFQFMSAESLVWQTYRNEKYGYEIKCPGDWILFPKIKDQVTLNGPNKKSLNTDITISYFNSINDVMENKYFDLQARTLDELVNEIPPIADNISNKKKIKFAGENAWTFTWDDGSAYYRILISRNGHIYEIMFGNKSSQTELSDTENQILSTFKFTK